jgi:hypothetical protein
VLPEDDANRQLANGFRLEVNFTRDRRMQVLQPAGGWREVIDRFKLDHVVGMNRYPNRSMVLLIDFDGQEDRREFLNEGIPDHLKDRVFILGSKSEPEALKAELGTYEQIGRRLAQDCRDDSYANWGHELLRHNSNELDRLRTQVRPILFDVM